MGGDVAAEPALTRGRAPQASRDDLIAGRQRRHRPGAGRRRLVQQRRAGRPAGTGHGAAQAGGPTDQRRSGRAGDQAGPAGLAAGGQGGQVPAAGLRQPAGCAGPGRRQRTAPAGRGLDRADPAGRQCGAVASAPRCKPTPCRPAWPRSWLPAEASAGGAGPDPRPTCRRCPAASRPAPSWPANCWLASPCSSASPRPGCPWSSWPRPRSTSALLGFVVYTGSDYVDAPRLERIGRVPGVLHVVETGLA